MLLFCSVSKNACKQKSKIEEEEEETRKYFVDEQLLRKRNKLFPWPVFEFIYRENKKKRRIPCERDATVLSFQPRVCVCAFFVSRECFLVCLLAFTIHYYSAIYIRCEGVTGILWPCDTYTQIYTECRSHCVLCKCEKEEVECIRVCFICYSNFLHSNRRETNPFISFLQWKWIKCDDVLETSTHMFVRSFSNNYHGIFFLFIFVASFLSNNDDDGLTETIDERKFSHTQPNQNYKKKKKSDE